MKKLFKRFVAYIIDMLVILLITQSLSGIPQINNQLNDYNKYYNKYYTDFENYAYLKNYLHSDLDKELTEEEYYSLLEQYPDYKKIIDERYQKNTLTEDEYNELAEEIDKIYNDLSKKVAYKVEKNSIAYFVIYLIAVFTYFVGFNKYTSGQTLGKKLMRLKIINSHDESKAVPIWSYIVRALILYQPISYIIKLIGVIFMNIDMYYNITSIVYSIQGYLEMLIVAMMMIRFDGRGPQDLLARTRVISYDKNGKEIKDKLDIMINTKKENINKKIIDEPTDN